MKILIYSDLHISKTSSILPNISDNPLYTYRQNMIIKIGEYMQEVVEKEKPDIIINLGDTFDQHTITSYDVKVAAQFFNCFSKNSAANIPHYVLVGNHEMINQDFNAIALLNNIPNITVIDEPTIINDLAFLPYCDHKSILEFPKGTYLFSHQDIQGSSIRGDFTLPDGISPDTLNIYKLVFNGHIHKSSVLKNIVNVGSVSTHSFSDDEGSVPQFYMFDTSTLDLKTFRPLVCPLFRKLDIQTSLSEFDAFVDNLDKNYKYVLHIICPYDLRDAIKEKINSYSDLIINSRLNLKVSKEKADEEITNINLQANIDINQSFKDFLDITELKYPKDLYLNILKEVM